MSDDFETQEVSTDVVDDDSVSSLTEAQLRAELAKVRREAAARRVKQRETDAALTELQKYKDAEKTEMQRIQERAEKAETEAAAYAKEKAALAAAKQAGLDPEFAEFLRGNTEEELAKSAAELAARIPKKPASDLLAGNRGGPVRSTGDSASDNFRKLFTQ